MEIPHGVPIFPFTEASAFNLNQIAEWTSTVMVRAEFPAAGVRVRRLKMPNFFTISPASPSPLSGRIKITTELFSFGGSMERESAGEPAQIATENADLAADLRRGLSYVRKHHKITN